MKILYAIQGTGNGHVSRARDIVPLLKKNHEVDILVSGTQCDVDLPYDIKYRLSGLSFTFGKKGGIDIMDTYKKSNIRRLYSEIHALPVEAYDLILNDFEPVSAWACQQKKKLCIGLSHQSAVINKRSPQPKSFDLIGKTVLKNYAPCDATYGFHFQRYDHNIFTPVIRQQAREIAITNKGHYTVYLPAYSDKRIIKILREFKGVQWQVFSKHTKKNKDEKNIQIRPVSNEAFIESMASSAGVFCGAGFETPAEALFMKKKLMVIPMKGQYEQQCNATALKKMGIPVIKSLKEKHIDKIKKWLQDDTVIEVDYPDETEAILTRILEKHTPIEVILRPAVKEHSFKEFMELSLSKAAAE